MSKVDIIGKWDLNNNSWYDPYTEEERGKSLSLVSLKNVITDESYNYEYFIFCPGIRLENVSKDSKIVSDKAGNIDKAIKYFGKLDKNIHMKLLLLDNDAPLKEESVFLGNHIESISSNPHINSINVIAHSKGAAVAFDSLKYIKRPLALSKTNLFTTAVPFKGTIMVSPAIFYPKLERIIQNKINNEFLAKEITKAISSVYSGISSNSHMDYDIAIPGGADPDKYDETFIEKLLQKENLDMISKINSYHNIYTGIEEDTFRKCLKAGDFAGMGLCLMDDLIFDEKSDGIVPLSSQQALENLNPEELKIHQVKSSTNNIFGNVQDANEVFSIINDEIDETKEKAYYKKLKK